MSLSQDRRMQIEVKIMECKALAGLCGDDLIANAVWDAQIKLWESILEKAAADQ